MEAIRDLADERHRMVTGQLRPRGIRDPRLLAAFESVPRHLFLPEAERPWAYEDGAQPIGHEQTISQPYIVALMTQVLSLTGSERVLEVGTGSGYQAAILSGLALEIHTLELIPELAARASHTLAELGLTNVQVHTGDGSLGWPAAMPYDAILVAAAAPRAPQPLLDQLADGGRMVIPVGAYGYQYLELWRRHGRIFDHEALLSVAFVPLRGKHGW